MHWLYVHFGIGGSGPWYAFWSGFGRDLGELAIVAGIWHLVNCNEKGCYRPGRHYRGHVICHKHRNRADESASSSPRAARELLDQLDHTGQEAP